MYNSMALEFKRRAVERAAFASSYVFGHADRVAVPVAAHRQTRWCATAATKATSRTPLKLNAGLPAAVRPRPAVRQQRQRRSSIASSAAGSSPATRACRAAGCSTSATCGSSAWTEEELQKRVQAADRRPAGRVFMLPQEIIDEIVQGVQRRARRRRPATAASGRRAAATSRRPTASIASRRSAAKASAACSR